MFIRGYEAGSTAYKWAARSLGLCSHASGTAEAKHAASGVQKEQGQGIPCTEKAQNVTVGESGLGC